MMHVWLTGEDDEKITGLRVEQWANKTRVPGWVVLRIFGEYPDLRDFAFAALPAEQVDPQVAALYKRLDRLLQKKFLLLYFQLQVTLCEALVGLEAQELERIVKTTAEVVANAITHGPDSAVSDPTSKNTK